VLELDCREWQKRGSQCCYGLEGAEGFDLREVYVVAFSVQVHGPES
jgi:hypothetical protein